MARPNTADPVIESSSEIQGGVPIFVRTRVPVRNLIDYLSAADTLDDFLEAFPTVTREQAIAALEIAGENVTAGAHTAR